MKKMEFKKVGPGSAFKTTLYLMVIPMALIVLISLIGILIGVASGERIVAIFGVVYLFIPIVAIIFYSGISALVALVYNLFARKFGGLEVYVDEQTKERSEDNTYSDDVN